VLLPWRFQEVGVDGRSLEVRVTYGGCQSNPRATALETAYAIRVHVTVQVPRDSAHAICPAIAVFAERRVSLRKAVAGRPISGAKEEHERNVVSSIRANGPRVPRLTGLFPGDALRVARNLGFTTSVVQEVGIATPAEVISQLPAPGQRMFAPHARTRDVLRRSRRMVLATGAAGAGQTTRDLAGQTRALAFTRAVNLHMGDAAGFTVAIGAERETTSRPGSTAAQEAACFGGPDPRAILVDRESPWLGRPRQSISSSVELWPNAELARHAAAAEYGHGAIACERTRIARAEREADNPHSPDPAFSLHTHTTLTRLALDVRGIVHVYATRTVEDDKSVTTEDGRHLHHRRDRLALVVGRAVVSLYAENCSTRLERRLLGLLSRRARGASRLAIHATRVG
jgi:hypothetical protein